MKGPLPGRRTELLTSLEEVAGGSGAVAAAGGVVAGDRALDPAAQPACALSGAQALGRACLSGRDPLRAALRHPLERAAAHPWLSQRQDLLAAAGRVGEGRRLGAP